MSAQSIAPLWAQGYGLRWPVFVAYYLVTTGSLVAGLALRRARWARLALAPAAGVPLTAIGLMGAFAIQSMVRAIGLDHPPWTMLGALGLVAAGFLGARISPRSAPGLTVRRGTLIESDSTGSVASTHRFKLQFRGVLRFAGVDLLPADETKHFKLIGTTGTGKSTAIRRLLEGALARGDRAVFADPDGGYLARFYQPSRGDVILNPFDARSHKWSVFGELRADYDFDQLARSLIADGSGPDVAWRNYAQTYFSSVLRQARAGGVTETAELYRLLTSASLEELRTLLDGTPAQPFAVEGNERMFGSIRSITGNAVASLAFIGRQSGEPFSIRDWVERGNGVMFLPYQADQIATLRGVISTWLRIAVFQAMSQGEADHRLWFVIDELDALGAIDGLKDALARLRKFGGRCVLGFQSIAQVSGLYGTSDAQTIVENCGNTLILRCSASEKGGTAQFASRLIGEREIVRDTVSRSRSAPLSGDSRGSITRSVQHVIEQAVLASEIEQLPDLEGYLKLASRPQWHRVRLHRP